MPIEHTHTFTAPGPDLSTELTRRAKAAWFDTGGTVSPTDASGVVLRNELGYVVLRDADGAMLAVYRIRPDNLTLQRMKRPPRVL
jgi:hypothetical protein